MKNDRQNEILKIIENNEVETQAELAEKLASAGYAATQATVSRDIRELGLVKEPSGNGNFRYAARGSDTGYVKFRVLRDSVVGAELVGNILVIKTISGMAMAAAAALDDWNCDAIAGCIAGDDTIFAAVSPGKEEYALSELKKIIG